MTRATLVVYQNEGDPIVIEFDVKEDDPKTVITLTSDSCEVTTPDEPKVIPTAACPKHFASALDVQGGDGPESWWFQCRTHGEVYTYAELQNPKEGESDD